MVSFARNTGYPFFLPTFSGSGDDGVLVLTTNSDVGYLGAYGVKQATNASLAAGQTLTLATGTSSGALIMGCTGKLTIAGTITADGANGSNAAAAGASSGAGGGTAGAGTGGAAVVAENGGAAGIVATKAGHGSRSINNGSVAVGGGSGALGTNAAFSGSGSSISTPIIDTTSTLNSSLLFDRGLIQPSKGGVYIAPVPVTTISGTASSAGTVSPVNPTTSQIGPWAQSAVGLFLPRAWIPGGTAGYSGGVTVDGSGNDAAGGGGGGGGGVIIIEADTIELVAGYAINARGGNGGNATTQGGTSTAVGGSGGWGGIVIFICRTLIGSTAAINTNGGSAGTSAGAGAGTALAGIAGALYTFKV